jgi:hypothetical protein
MNETMSSIPSLTKKKHKKGKKREATPGTAVHACNPRYSGGRDQEDHGSKPAQQIVP